MTTVRPGTVVLLSSGETSTSGRRLYDWLFRRLPQPPIVSVVETPAGFQPNSFPVANRIAEFMRQHLAGHQPAVTVVAARARGTAFSPDGEDVVAPIRRADAVFLGPGSPSYAVRQLEGSLTWQTILARHRRGAALILASAATIAISEMVLPVYEIYKVGEDLHWLPGLNLLGAYGLRLALVSHWNNTDGGAELDTSYGFVGRDRFVKLQAMLPPAIRVLGIDEHTALVIDLMDRRCRVMGRGGICLCQVGTERRFEHGQELALEELGTVRMPDPLDGIPPSVWEQTQVESRPAAAQAAARPPTEVLTLVRQREEARSRRDWSAADRLRRSLADLGWEVRDTPGGPQVSLAQGGPA